MPKGDRYVLTGFTKGPKRTTKHLNSHVTALQDALDRIADLEAEADAGGGGANGTITAIVCPDGVAQYATIVGTLGAIV